MASTVVKSPQLDVKPYPALQVIKKDQPGFYVWRVVKFGVELVPEDAIGKFYTGDCYIILAIMQKLTDMRIHFWIGEESSIDERAVAAMLSFALDDHFGGTPVQTREVQGAESAMFLKYFSDRKKTLQYMTGGVESGLRQATAKEHVNALYHVKGSTKINRIVQVPIVWESFNQGDTFVLDMGAVVFLWKGAKTGTGEFYIGAQFAQRIRSDRGMKSCEVVQTQDGREEEMDKTHLEMWNKVLPLSEKNVRAADKQDDVTTVKAQTAGIKLHCCKENGGETTISEVKSGPLSRSDLQSDDSFIVDNGPAGVWAWIGKGATADERRLAMHYAMGFVESNNYPPSTRVTRVVDGGETAEFRALFSDWK